MRTDVVSVIMIVSNWKQYAGGMYCRVIAAFLDQNKEGDMRKRLLVILLSAAVIFTFMPATAYAGTPDSWDSTHTYYYDEHGDPYADAWEEIDGDWYYFQSDGKVARKWFYNDINKAYFYGHPSTGAIFTGWHKINGYWYYFSLDDMTTEDGSRYYWCGGMYDYGAALIKGNWYYLAKSDNASKWGKMQTGWIKESGTYSHSDGSKWTYEDWYYADPNNDSRLVKGWKKISGKWYYFDPDERVDYHGLMIANTTKEINGKLYAFNRDGSLHETAGWAELYDTWVDKNGKTQKQSYWVYTDKNGVAVTGWKKIAGTWYRFWSDGYMAHDEWAEDSAGWMYLGSNGKPYYSKWLKYEGEWYYLKANGYRATDWCKIDGVWYRFKEDGKMIHDDWEYDSVGWFYLGSDGKPYRNKWLNHEGDWLYYKDNCYEARSEWLKIGGYWYSFDEFGRMRTNYWADDSVGRCWMDSDGHISKSRFVTFDGYTYYIKANGYMAHDETLTIEGKTYSFGPDGKMQ